jgi:hypothetical protein
VPNRDLNRLLLRARDTMDRDYAGELDVEALAASAFLSPAGRRGWTGAGLRGANVGAAGGY